MISYTVTQNLNFRVYNLPTIISVPDFDHYYIPLHKGKRIKREKKPPKHMLMQPTDEHLIKYGLDEDVWFHVDKLSSAHVYLRMNEGDKLNHIGRLNFNRYRFAYFRD